jgi:hypothetical protein
MKRYKVFRSERFNRELNKYERIQMQPDIDIKLLEQLISSF